MNRKEDDSDAELRDWACCCGVVTVIAAGGCDEGEKFGELASVNAGVGDMVRLPVKGVCVAKVFAVGPAGDDGSSRTPTLAESSMKEGRGLRLLI